MVESNPTAQKSTSSQLQQGATNPGSNEPVLFSNAEWFIHSNEHKSHKKGKGGPVKRWGHSSVVKDHRLLIYGGNGRNPRNVRHWQCFYELDLLEWEWNKLEPTNRAPPIRDSHSAILVGNDIYIYGGSDGNTPKSEDLFRYDLNTSCWERIEATGEIPVGREGHTACLLHGKYMVIYGGWGPKEDVLTDVHCFDIEKKKWSQVIKKSGPDPKPRESQGSCAIKDYIYIFGGQGSNETIGDFNYEVYLNDLFRFKLEIEDDKFYSVWEELKPTGPKPSKRSSPSVCSYKDRYIFLIGGEGYSKEFDEESPLGSNPQKQRDVLKKNNRNEDENITLFPKSDVWYYDTELNFWTKLKIKNGNEFFPHFAHTSNNYEDFIIVFGGLSNDYNTPHDEVCILSLTGADPVKFTKNLKKKKKEPESSQSNNNKQIESSPKPQIISTIQTKTRAPLCQHCKNKLTNTYNSITAAHHYSKISESKGEDAPRARTATSLVSKSGPVITGAYLYMLSQLIGWPFAAFGLLIDNSVGREACNFLIDFVIKTAPPAVKQQNAIQSDGSFKKEEEEPKGQEEIQKIPEEQPIKEEEMKSNIEPIKQEEQPQREEQPKDQDDLPIAYIQLIDNGRAWTPEEFVDMIADYDVMLEDEQPTIETSPVVGQTQEEGGAQEERKEEKIEPEKQPISPANKQYSLNLKIAGLRLGNTIVVYSKDSDYTCIGYISIQKMTNIHVPSSNSFLYVCWENKTGVFRTLNGEKTKQIILSSIKDYVSEEELSDLNNLSGTKVLILSLKTVPIFRKEANKACNEYELISVKNKAGIIEDIQIRTLDPELKRKFHSDSNNRMIEFSLIAYLKAFFLEPRSAAEMSLQGKRDYEICFNRKKIDLINVKKVMEELKEQHKESFVEFNEPKLFEGLVGAVQKGNYHNKSINRST